MNIDHLREFVELSRQLNFTEAARTLHMTQPALSTHLRKMEQEIGSRLVERAAGSPIHLTPAGEQLFEAANHIVEVYDSALSSIQELKREISGSISVRSPRHEYSEPLLAYIFEFRTQYPNVNVELLPWTKADAAEDVLSGNVDFAFGKTVLPGTENEQELRCIPYARCEVVLWLDKNHDLVKRKHVAVDDLEGATVVMPANHKRSSWLGFYEAALGRHGVHYIVRERYCDSLEDFLQARVQPNDILINQTTLLSSPVCSLRKDRCVVHFDPPLTMPSCVVCRQPGSNSAADAFASFLEEKGKGAGYSTRGSAKDRCS